jgi:hypothetical protein
MTYLWKKRGIIGVIYCSRALGNATGSVISDVLERGQMEDSVQGWVHLW